MDSGWRNWSFQFYFVGVDKQIGRTGSMELSFELATPRFFCFIGISGFPHHDPITYIVFSLLLSVFNIILCKQQTRLALNILALKDDQRSSCLQ